MSAATIATATAASRPLDPSTGAAAARAATAATSSARARLAPLSEPSARSLPATGPCLSPAPLAGSVEARTRITGAPGTGQVRAGLPAAGAPDCALPDPMPLCCAMVQAAVEALRGARPLAQLARWVSPEIYEQLSVRSELTQRVRGDSPGTHRAAIRRIRMCRLGDRAAEATVVVDDGPRVRAVAVRLEGHRGQWRATALEIG